MWHQCHVALDQILRVEDMRKEKEFKLIFTTVTWVPRRYQIMVEKSRLWWRTINYFIFEILEFLEFYLIVAMKEMCNKK